MVAPSHHLSLRSDDGSTTSSDDGSGDIASATMSVQSVDDLPPDAPRCLRCFPTGSECLRFYIVAFISIVIVLCSVAYMIARPDEPAGRCVFTGMITAVMSFWIQPPTIGVGRKTKRHRGRKGAAV